MRRTLLFLALLGGMTPAAAKSVETAPKGDLQVILFRAPGQDAVAGALIEMGGRSATTNDDGAARLRVRSGDQNVVITLSGPKGPTIHTLPVKIVAEETSQLLLTFDAVNQLVDEDREIPGESSLAAERAFIEAQKTRPVGTLSGRVVSEDKGTPVVGAKVLVLGAPTEAETRKDGRFSLDLPEGTYGISIIHSAYSTFIDRAVVVQSGQETTLNPKLAPASIALDDFVITIPRLAGTVAKVLDERRKSAAVQDALGAEELARSPDGSASSASRRIVGASVVGGQFLIVRGLGGRYTNVRLNGVSLPSTDPDMPGVQIDLFPASLLENLTIAKTFTADIPGSFAGGSMNIVTKSFPEAFKASFSISGAYDTQSTFDTLMTSPGGSLDWLAMDDGTRALPDGFPARRVSTVGEDAFNLDELQEIGRSLPDTWDKTDGTVWPNLSLGASVGDTVKIAGRNAGYLLTLGYKRKMDQDRDTLTNLKLEGVGEEQRLSVREVLQRDVGTKSALIGGLASLSYAVSERSELRLASLLTQTADDKTYFVTGVSENENVPLQQTLLRYVQRRLWLNQLLGTHRDLIGDMDLSWQVNTAQAARAQPNSRSMMYTQRDDGDPFAYRDTTGSGERLFSTLGQLDLGGGTDLVHPLWGGEIKSGIEARTSERVFSARRFGVRFLGRWADRIQPADDLFAAENYGDILELTELTRADDGYVANQSLFSSYLSLELPLQDWVKANVGARFERFHQEIRAESPFATDTDVANEGDRLDEDVLPAASLVFTTGEKSSIRLAYGGTVARPLVREFAPFLSQDFIRRRGVQGNPELERTAVHNLDARWEFFPSGTEVFAISGFYKIFDNPIESVVVDTNGNITYQNVEGAENFGIEFEARSTLDRLIDGLADFEILGNFTLVHSRVTLSDAQRSVATSKTRPLAGQSPYVANVSLGYVPDDTPLSLFIYYNVFGPRIRDVGLQGLPDIVEESVHGLDATAFWQLGSGWTLSFAATNLLGQPKRLTQGPFDFSLSEQGTSASAKLSWKY